MGFKIGDSNAALKYDSELHYLIYQQLLAFFYRDNEKVWRKKYNKLHRKKNIESYRRAAREHARRNIKTKKGRDKKNKTNLDYWYRKTYGNLSLVARENNKLKKEIENVIKKNSTNG